MWFWFLNECTDRAQLLRQLDAMEKAGAQAAVLHPREGLLVPHGGDDWWDLIRWLVDQCLARGIQPWVYDEDPYPSGNAGGRLIAEHPEWQMRQIERHQAAADLKPDEVFLFPMGKLCWAGLVPPVGSDAQPIDLTTRVGTMRRVWDYAPWDSRWYYPTTPRYPCDRAVTHLAEWSLRVPEIPTGWKLVAFVARRFAESNNFGGYVDTLNRAATEAFIAEGYARQQQVLGAKFGREVPAMFTDEPKLFTAYPYTPGLFERFEETFGYDLRPRLEHLFTTEQHPQVWRTRMHFRRWTGRLFEENWVKPIGDWCKKNGIIWTGHISPEDDPIQQALCLGNLMPLQRHFGLAGLDLIIPAVGDRANKIINVGHLQAVSAAQQQNLPGVMSETLGASGFDLTGRESARILAWQVASGVGTIVIHGVFVSMLGLRRYDAPPDFSPDSERWPGVVAADHGLRPFMDIVNRNTQHAPVAVLWPIRDYQAMSVSWEHDDVGPRKQLTDLLQACLEHQVGIHLLDEDDLADVVLENGQAKLGLARYTHVVLPPLQLLSAQTVALLGQFQQAGVKVTALGAGPVLVDSAQGLVAVESEPWPRVQPLSVDQWVQSALPQVAPLQSDAAPQLRATRWVGQNADVLLLMNLGPRAASAQVEGTAVELADGELIALRKEGGRWVEQHRFASQSVPADAPAPAQLKLTDWSFRRAEGDWRQLDRPRAVYELVQVWNKPAGVLPFELTTSMPIGGAPVDRFVEYRAKLQLDQPLPRAEMWLEPTAQRGRFMVQLNGQEWDVTLDDTDSKPVALDLRPHLQRGENVLTFRLLEPMPLDGVKIGPSIWL